MLSSEISIAGALASIFIFVGFLWGVLRIFIWLWVRLPSRVISIQSEQLDKTLGVLFAIALFPGIALYAWSVIGNLIGSLSWFISNIGSWPMSPGCNGDEPNCLPDVARSVARMLGTASAKIYEAISLSNFPVFSFLRFLFTAVLATQVMSFTRKQVVAGNIKIGIRLYRRKCDSGLHLQFS